MERLVWAFYGLFGLLRPVQVGFRSVRGPGFRSGRRRECVATGIGSPTDQRRLAVERRHLRSEED